MTDVNQYSRILLDGESTYLQVPPSGPARILECPPWEGVVPSGRTLTAEQLSLCPQKCPAEPSKIIGIGRNYRKHAAELNHDVPTEPLMFFKPPSSLTGPGGNVLLPPESDRVDYEGELAVIIGQACRRVTERQAMEFVFGYSLACDVTARDLQNSDHQWTRGKGFDSFCPLGPSIVRNLDPSKISLKLVVGEKTKQNGSTADMIFGVATLISYISQCMTLLPGDVILTGTPEGVGPLRDGHRITISGTGLSNLQFNVKSEA